MSCEVSRSVGSVKSLLGSHNQGKVEAILVVKAKGILVLSLGVLVTDLLTLPIVPPAYSGEAREVLIKLSASPSLAAKTTSLIETSPDEIWPPLRRPQRQLPTPLVEDQKGPSAFQSVVAGVVAGGVVILSILIGSSGEDLPEFPSPP